MGYLKNEKLIKQFADRLKCFRLSANLSVQQMQLATGISTRQINLTENGKINTSISHIGAYADLFGVQVHVLLNFDSAVPDEASLRQGVKKFVKSHGLDPVLFFKPSDGATNVIENKILKTSFLNTPRYAREIADYCKEKYQVNFTTNRLSKVLDNLDKKGLVVKIKTDKKSKYQYRKIPV